MNAPNAYVGSPVERVEDLRLLRGRGEFIDDVAAAGQLFAVILRSSVAHGLIRRLDVAPAVARPGVHAVMTAADLGPSVPTVPLRLQPLDELIPFCQPALADGKVRYVGEPIAMVLADTVAIAEDALDAILIEIETLPIAAGAPDGRDASLLFSDQGTNVALTYHAVRGDAERAFKDAPYRRQERFRVQRHAAMPMEPRGLFAVWNEASGHMTLVGAAKVPGPNRKILARMMGISPEAIDLVEVDTGGGFGSRGEFYPEDFLVPFAARHYGRPVKWTEDRREHLMAANHARDVDVTVEIACTRDGTILGLRGHAVCDIGAYIRTNGSVGPRNIVQFLSGPYRIPDIDLVSTMLVSNKTPAGTYRGPGRFEADFIRERLFDLVAKDLKIDRIAFRRRNLVAEAEMPYPIATITPYESKTEYDSGNYLLSFESCLEKFGWAEKSKLSGQLIDGRYHGIGTGCFIEGGAAGPKEDARIVVEVDGRITVYVGSTSVGQGIETILGQIAADALEVPLERITVRHGSTNYVPDGYGSYHSRSTVMGGSAILIAVANLKTALATVAADKFGVAAEAVSHVDGQVVLPDGGSHDWADLASEHDPLKGIAGAGSFANHKYTYAYGSHAAHVAVDPATGHVEVLDYVCTEDVGRIINPKTLHGQVIGAVVQGLGGVFLEHLVYDDQGQLLTGSFADYLLPTAGDYPNIRAYSTGDYPSPFNPLGAKGAGEGGIISVGGVISNAVADALQSIGVEPTDLPLSPPRVWQMIQDAAKR